MKALQKASGQPASVLLLQVGMEVANDTGLTQSKKQIPCSVYMLDGQFIAPFFFPLMFKSF
jgi:hypothetical protein